MRPHAKSRRLGTTPRLDGFARDDIDDFFEAFNEAFIETKGTIFFVSLPDGTEIPLLISSDLLVNFDHISLNLKSS